MSLASNKSCNLCKHYNAMLATLRREPFLGYVPCTSCSRFQLPMADKFEPVSRDSINKKWSATP